jgi:sRNA-binding carbon storage regulator CsrA
MLRIDLRPGEAIVIGDAVVTLEDKSGKIARLSVQADKSIPVRRVQEQGTIAKMVAEQGITRKA